MGVRSTKKYVFFTVYQFNPQYKNVRGHVLYMVLQVTMPPNRISEKSITYIYIIGIYHSTQTQNPKIQFPPGRFWIHFNVDDKNSNRHESQKRIAESCRMRIEKTIVFLTQKSSTSTIDQSLTESQSKANKEFNFVALESFEQCHFHQEEGTIF